jgi:glycine dehydrogenase
MSLDIDTAGRFATRHVGPRDHEIESMLASLGVSSLSELVGQTVPDSIRLEGDLDLPEASPEHLLLRRLEGIGAKNKVFRSYLGMGYHDTVVPGVILRNILENPGWYTAYTPYQAEIAQGRLEALLNYQTMVIDLTGLEIANASLLDESTAAAEAMAMLHGDTRDEKRTRFFVSEVCHPQTIAVVKGRAAPLGIEVVVGAHDNYDLESFGELLFGGLVQYPATDGAIHDYRAFCGSFHEAGAGVVMAADLMSLAMLTPPGELGADIAVGTTQRFGVPMGFGGPHAAYMAADDRFKRKMPGRIIGASVDVDGDPALRMALQTREQHIRREKATSNICTAQVLLAIMAGMYAVYHGPEGLQRIAGRIHHLASTLAHGLRELGHSVVHEHFFDTLQVVPAGVSSDDVIARAHSLGMNLRDYGDGTVGVSVDETTLPEDLDDLFDVFSDGGPQGGGVKLNAEGVSQEASSAIPGGMARTSSFMEHPVFHKYRSETEILRYIHKLESRDLSLNTSMISLGSCTMKLNATTQMLPVTWKAFGGIHPFAPSDQTQGYQELLSDLESWLAEISGFAATSLQPNSGASGEYAGLLVIRALLESRGEGHRDVCLIPSSAHGTNPASAVMAGMRVVVVQCDDNGNIDLGDLEAKADEYASDLAAMMITYPSTHGVFESEIRRICDIVHDRGGRVYLDGANLNAQVGLCRPGDYGADVCHINLHKTFSIPHGGGGPGVGPICVTAELAPFLPGHPVIETGGSQAILPVSSAPWGSGGILVISWSYIALLGKKGVRRATEAAILNANYMANRLQGQFDVLYRGENGRVAHEFILDLRPLKKETGISDEDVAKRLMDYGFHAPTMSFPVAGTMMVEPTESESKVELDRLCDALVRIRAEIQEVESGEADPEDNVLKNAPHTAGMLTASEWEHSYSREKAAYPAPWTRDHKFWPPVRRVNNVHGDRNLVCACPPIEAYAEVGDG